MFSKLRKALSGATSDHAAQFIQIAQYGKHGGDVHRFRLATWNLLNRCQDKSDCSIRDPAKKYSNNPVDEHETSRNYLKRKSEELIKIIQIIDEEGVDAIFLQEPDIICKPPSEIFDDESSIAEILKLRQLFSEMLSERGWACAQTVRGQRVQMLVTLINENRFEVADLNVSPLFPSRHGRHRASTIEVRDKRSKQCFELINTHLDPISDYSQEILNYMYPKTKNGIGVLMGGDMNHTIRSMPIKVGPVAVASATNAKAIELGQQGLPHPPNAIDSFFASPSSILHWLRPEQYWGEEFVNEGRKTLLTAYKSKARSREAFPGQPMLETGLLGRLLACPYNKFGAPMLANIEDPDITPSPKIRKLSA